MELYRAGRVSTRALTTAGGYGVHDGPDGLCDCATGRLGGLFDREGQAPAEPLTVNRRSRGMPEQSAGRLDRASIGYRTCPCLRLGYAAPPSAWACHFFEKGGTFDNYVRHGGRTLRNGRWQTINAKPTMRTGRYETDDAKRPNRSSRPSTSRRRRATIPGRLPRFLSWRSLSGSSTSLRTSDARRSERRPLVRGRSDGASG